MFLLEFFFIFHFLWFEHIFLTVMLYFCPFSAFILLGVNFLSSLIFVFKEFSVIICSIPKFNLYVLMFLSTCMSMHLMYIVPVETRRRHQHSDATDPGCCFENDFN